MNNKIYTGKNTFKVSQDSTVIIKGDAPFNAYACIKREVQQVLGPFTTGQKIIKFKVPPGIDNILVKTSDNTSWQYEEIFPLKINTDSKPLEVSVKKPKTMKEEIAMYLTQAFMDMANQKEHEQPDDIFNFDEDEDDQAEFKTKYTINEDDLTEDEVQELKRLLAMSEELLPTDQQQHQPGKQEPGQERPATEDSTKNQQTSQNTNIPPTTPQPGS